MRQEDAPHCCKCWNTSHHCETCGVTCSTKILKLCGTCMWLTLIMRRGYLRIIFDWKVRKCTNSCCRAYPILAFATNKPTLSTLENTKLFCQIFSWWLKEITRICIPFTKPQPSGLALHPGTVTTIRITIHSKEIHSLWEHSNYLLSDTKWLRQHGPNKGDPVLTVWAVNSVRWRRVSFCHSFEWDLSSSC